MCDDEQLAKASTSSTVLRMDPNGSSEADPYKMIRAALGPEAIEADEVEPHRCDGLDHLINRHGGFEHIQLALDGEVGRHLRLGSEFVRPKWGIYRSLIDRDSLTPDEESLGIAALQISRGIDEPTA